MNWFQRHLNWTVLLSFGVNCLIITIIIAISPPDKEPLITSISDVQYLVGIWAVSTSIPLVVGAQSYAYFTIYFLIPVSLFLVLSGWVIHQKGRTLWWLLLPALLPLGWLAVVTIKNRRT